jgi:hypothetical protein
MSKVLKLGTALGVLCCAIGSCGGDDGIRPRLIYFLRGVLLLIPFRRIALQNLNIEIRDCTMPACSKGE